MRITTAALLLLLSLPAFGAIEITSLTTDKPSYMTGERMTVTLGVRNAGPGLAGVGARVDVSDAVTYLTASASGAVQWSCSVTNYGQCSSLFNLSSGSSAELVFTMLAPPRVPATPRVYALVSGISRELPITIVPAPRTAGLSMRTAAPASAEPGVQAQVDFIVTNGGPDPAENVIVKIASGYTPAVTTGWTCTSASGITTCTRPTLPAGASGTIGYRFTVESQPTIHFGGNVQSELNHDPVANEYAEARILVGSFDDWERLLVPITATRIPGANGSLWKTDVTMLFRSDTVPVIEPNPCNTPILCLFPPMPVRVPFDLHEHGVIGFTPSGGQFIHIAADEVDKVAINGRFYDESRLTETAGTELPIVRMRDFRTSTVALIGIPVAPQYRHTLRVYEGDSRNTHVAIRVYADDETAPRLATTRALTRAVEQTEPTFTPYYPGYAELALGQLLALDGIETLRVELEPLEAGTRIWGFVSITNNDTHHVTLVSPQ